MLGVLFFELVARFHPFENTISCERWLKQVLVALPFGVLALVLTVNPVLAM